MDEFETTQGSVPPGRGPLASQGRVIAVVQAMGRRIGIDGESVIQAVVVPDDLQALPRRAGAMVGVMSHAGGLVPVVRLEHWLQSIDADSNADGADASTPADARILVLRDGERVVGLFVDAVIGMSRCAAGAIVRLFHDDDPDELFASAVLVDPAQPPVALLDPTRLARLSGIWAASAGVSTGGAATAVAVDPAASTVSASDRVTFGVFRIGDTLVGIAADNIGELLRLPALRPPPFHHPAARGLCEWRGRLLPVVDIAGAVDASVDAAPAWLCVVLDGDALLGIAVNEIVALQAFERPSSATDAGASTSIVRDSQPTKHGIVQIVDAAALMARYPESTIGGNRDASSAKRAEVTSPHPYMVFESAGRYATRVDHVHEVMPLPSALGARLQANLPASIEWRGHVVPVRGLFADAGKCLPPSDARQLIIVVDGTSRCAIPIARVEAMIAPRTATLSRVRVRDAVVNVVSTLASSEAAASYELVDLATP